MEYVPREGIDYITDLYAVAGIDRAAPEEDIRRMINGQIMQYHPDRLEGMAPEFVQKGERMSVLLNRAREILLHEDKRALYDSILEEWDGPVSTTGAPVISVGEYRQISLDSKTPEEVEALVARQVEKIDELTGFSPSRLAFIENLVHVHGNEIPDELRQEYEQALLQQDRRLALEEAERGSLIGLPDIENIKYKASLDYIEKTAESIEGARADQISRIQSRALGRFAVRLELLSGDAAEGDTQEITEPVQVELPSYFDKQAKRIQEIAAERQEITEKRLENYQPFYPEEELQTELKDKLLVGIDLGDQNRWFAMDLDVETDTAEPGELTNDISMLIGGEEYSKIIRRGYGIIIVKPMEQIELSDLLEVSIAKYTDKYTSITDESPATA